MSRPTLQTILDRVPPQMGQEVEKRMGQVFVDEMSREHFRLKVQEIIDERADYVPFKEKIQKYATEEIDKRIFRSVGYYFSILGIPLLITLVILGLEYFIGLR